MELTRMIPLRRSVRSYRSESLALDVLDRIVAFADSIAPLDQDVQVQHRLIGTSQARFLQKWKTPHAFVFFAENTEKGLINVGYMYQHLDLYLQSLGLGACWVGLGWLHEDVPVPPGMTVAVMMPFGTPDDVPLRTGEGDFRRKAMADITDAPDDRLEVARLAPSATNSQPWYFTHASDAIHVYREQLSGIKLRTLGRMNPIDMGIALAHLYVAHRDTFRFTREDAPVPDGYLYVGTVRL